MNNLNHLYFVTVRILVRYTFIRTHDTFQMNNNAKHDDRSRFKTIDTQLHAGFNFNRKIYMIRRNVKNSIVRRNGIKEKQTYAAQF